MSNHQHTLIIDGTSGISGDMTVAALLDLGASEEHLREQLATLPVDGFTIAVTRVSKHGIDACDFDVQLAEELENHDHDMVWLYGNEAAAEHTHEHEHHHHDGECGCGHDHHHHHADEVFTSWGMETTIPCTKADLEAILDELAYGNGYGDVLRAKGMLPNSEKQGEWFYFDLVPEEYEIRTGAPDYTGKVCVIGAKLKEDELNKAFKKN